MDLHLTECNLLQHRARHVSRRSLSNSWFVRLGRGFNDNWRLLSVSRLKEELPVLG